ncbi:conserved exported protein of unknown function [Candidatus Filomicrobium marinum]|uniref:Uncharacterized protein n=2 Tax=Filomicrobium TaxID=119044 RepID=A0A0D6JLQ3_9HYPH|nr:MULTISPECIES: hypothetical protein [Filomicrobium]MCV0369001.1 hypothetical protein [Filomicrobium sp.]CFX64330.1 conserved exported protein of unknown function [Candidatus Filomicrobium marinum]CPR22590.1 conserved exported protein of unknown function [Candidatus Filomicrobium marinum]SDO79160.1 hypothetical protein SAMN04488061_1666 [Filomicrobium insigne]
MYDKLLAIFSLALYLAFIAILGYAVEGWDIKIVLIITGLMVTYDFWREAFSKIKNGSKGH